MNMIARRIASGAATLRSPRSVSFASALLLVSRLGGAGLGVLTQIVVARAYGAESLGIFYVATSIASILSIVLTFGFPWIVHNVVSQSEIEQDGTMLSDFMASAWRHMGVATALLAVPAAVAVWYWPGISAAERAAYMVGVATAPSYAMMRHYASLANAHRHFMLANLPELLLRPALLLAFVAIALVAALSLTATGLVVANLVITLLLTAWIVLMLVLERRPKLPKRDAAPGEVRSNWRRLAFPMVVATLFVSVFADLAILVVGAIVPAHEAGIFGAAIKVAMLFAFAVQSVHQVIMRDTADAQHGGDPASMLKAIRTANIYSVTIMSLTLVFVIFFGGYLLRAFGDSFGEGHLCLILLVASQLVRAAGGPAIPVLVVADRQGAAMPVHAISIVTLAVLVWALVPWFGLAGAGASVVVTMTLWSVLLARLAFTITGIRCAIW